MDITNETSFQKGDPREKMSLIQRDDLYDDSYDQANFENQVFENSSDALN